VIRFSVIVSVVVVALVLLVVGAVSGTLMLVYLAIGVAGLALLLLIAGVLVWREEIFGGSAAARTAVGGRDVQFGSAGQFGSQAQFGSAGQFGSAADEPVIVRSGGPAAAQAATMTEPGPPARSAAPGWAAPAAYHGRGQAAEYGRPEYEPRDRVVREDRGVAEGRGPGGSRGDHGPRDDRARRSSWERPAGEPAAVAGWATAGGPTAQDDDLRRRPESGTEPTRSETARSESA
jgi:hypothetical protein